MTPKMATLEEFTDFLTGPLFEFPAQRALDLSQPEITEVPVLDEQDHYTTVLHAK